jgi:hypothetical protein
MRPHTAPRETTKGFPSNLVEHGLECVYISDFSSNRTTITDTLHQDTLTDALLSVLRSNTLSINLKNKCFEREKNYAQLCIQYVPYGSRDSQVKSSIVCLATGS